MNMLRISISHVFRDQSGESTELVAEFSVDRNGVHPLAGKRTDEVSKIPVIDPETGDRVLSGEDPLRWARLLPSALRAGDLAVRVEELVGPPGTQEASDPVAALAEQAGNEAVAAVNYA
jgi:hypothetical protein